MGQPYTAIEHYYPTKMNYVQPYHRNSYYGSVGDNGGGYQCRNMRNPSPIQEDDARLRELLTSAIEKMSKPMERPCIFPITFGAIDEPNKVGKGDLAVELRGLRQDRAKLQTLMTRVLKLEQGPPKMNINDSINYHHGQGSNTQGYQVTKGAINDPPKKREMEELSQQFIVVNDPKTEKLGNELGESCHELNDMGKHLRLLETNMVQFVNVIGSQYKLEQFPSNLIVNLKD